MLNRQEFLGESHMNVNWVVCNGTFACTVRVSQWRKGVIYQRMRMENNKAVLVVLIGHWK